MQTTAIYPNRIKDKERIDARGIPEFPDKMKPIKLYSRTHNELIAYAYVRVVYGDHGPYIEMQEDMVVMGGLKMKFKHEKAWYDEGYRDGVKLYFQNKKVNMLPNPPAGKYSFRGNRKEGYADYRVGKVYVDPDEVITEEEKLSEEPSLDEYSELIEMRDCGDK